MKQRLPVSRLTCPQLDPVTHNAPLHPSTWQHWFMAAGGKWSSSYRNMSVCTCRFNSYYLQEEFQCYVMWLYLPNLMLCVFPFVVECVVIQSSREYCVSNRTKKASVQVHWVKHSLWYIHVTTTEQHTSKLKVLMMTRTVCFHQKSRPYKRLRFCFCEPWLSLVQDLQPWPG